MARIDIPFVIEKQHITQPTREKLVAGGRNYFYATFKMCDVWSDITGLKAEFVREGVEPKLMELSETESGYECEIPWEVMADKGIFQVGIFGGDRLLTNYEYVIVLEGCGGKGGEPLAPTEDWFRKIEKQIADIANANMMPTCAFVNILGGIDNWLSEAVITDEGKVIGSRYGQIVNVNNAIITPNSKVDLQISSEQMVIFYEKDLAFVAENEDGVVTVYCVGNVPENDYTLQATITEVITNV